LSKLANEKTTPPNDTAAEESVLGSILIEPESMIKISDMLTHDDFFIDSNARIYEAIYSLFHAHKPIDIITLSTLLVEKGVFGFYWWRFPTCRTNRSCPQCKPHF
jgi:replicative DNA helicase